MPLPWILFAVAVVLWGADDRIIGKGTLGHTTIGLVLALIQGGWALAAGMPPRAAIAFPVVWLVYRVWVGWTFVGGSINPSPGKAQYTFLRHAMAFGYLVPAAMLPHPPLGPVALAMFGYALVATLLAVANYLTLAKANGTIEILRGLCLGAAVGWSFVLA